MRRLSGGGGEAIGSAAMAAWVEAAGRRGQRHSNLLSDCCDNCLIMMCNVAHLQILDLRVFFSHLEYENLHFAYSYAKNDYMVTKMQKSCR